MRRIAVSIAAYLMTVALVVGVFLLLGLAFGSQLPDVVRAITAVLLVNVVLWGMLVLVRRGESGSDDGDDNGGGGGGGGNADDLWPWPPRDGGGGIDVPDYVPEEWVAQPKV
ncbi:MAG: hypothetical protein JWP17_3599 [Solirubrobacterales bacterium]|jgi:uncharacterized membrane protein YgcG|nr:hypothetical protein [Solirubrobacterales bacterium]